MSTDDNAEPNLIVGIGASAGGLAAMRAFVSSLPGDTRMAFIIVQHLDPSHESLLADLLGKRTGLSVTNASDGQRPEPGHIYVIPENCYLELREGKIRLIESDHELGSRRAVDHFFRSLASERGEHCAGIVLSGAAGDGTAGLRAIKAAGGLALVQKPDTAEYRSMPQTAIDAKVVDKVLGIEEMGQVLQQYVDHPMTLRSGEAPNSGQAPDLTENLDEISSILQTKNGFFLQQYKTSTIKRRLARRMSLTGVQKYPAYLKLLREDVEERNCLIKDLLINVTDFFRDAAAFDVLENHVLPDIFKRAGPNEEIRIWVPGCASGEEAYSLAIVFLEARERSRRSNPIRIFATDVDEHAIATARKGVYPDSIAGEIPSNYLSKYFNRFENDHHYKVLGYVRDLVSFARQNVVSDPPFNHVHLVSCRNLLIYLNREAQETVLSRFYFSLDGPSYLFLGSSESLGARSESFRAVSKQWRIFQKIPGQKDSQVSPYHLHFDPSRRAEGEDGPQRRRSRRAEISRSDQIRSAMLDALAQPAVMVDGGGEILYVNGDLAPFLQVPTGEPRHGLLEHVYPWMRSRVRSGLHKVRKERREVTLNCVLPDTGKESAQRTVRVVLRPIEENAFSDGMAICVSFYEPFAVEDPGDIPLGNEDEARAARELERELVETKEELQATIEELETNSEELRASHEEVVSTNEELQSSNEELEASAEELRSLNEELKTVNSQLKETIDDLKRSNDDMENFFGSTGLPALFLDPELKIQRYTPAAEQLLKIGLGDIGREISTVGRDLIDDDLTDECLGVLNQFQPVRRKKRNPRGDWYIRQITPYRTEDRRVEGVVVLFHDITELRQLHQRVERREKQQAVVARLGILALSGGDPEELMHQAVREVAHTLDAEYCKVLKHQPDTQDLLMVAGVGWREGLVGSGTVPDSQDSQAGYTLLAKEPVIVKRLDTEKRFRGPALLIEHRVVSGMSCIISHTSPPFGVLGVHTLDEREFTEDDANFILSVANILASALHTRESRDQLHESEERFRTMANGIPQLAWMTDEKGYIFWYNQRWHDYTGETLDEMKGWGWRKVHHPDHVDRAVKQFKECIDTGTEWEDTFPLRGKDGVYRWFLSRAKPIRDQSGEVTRWFGTNTDVTEKLKQERELRESREKLRLAIGTNTIGTFEYSLRTEETRWDPLLRRVWGVADSEEPNQNIFWEGVHSGDSDRVKERLSQAADPDGDGHYHCIYRVINRQTKQISWVEASGQTFFKDGVPDRMIGLVIDITEEEETRHRLARSEERLRHTLATNRIGVWELDVETGKASRSVEHDQIFGYAELLPDWSYGRFLDHIHPEDRDRVDREFEDSKSRGIWDFECRIIRADTDEERWIWANGQLKSDPDHSAKRMVGLVQDITDRKKMETDLRRAISELQETDRKKNDFLSILGHELRNPLAALSSGIEIMGDAGDGDPEVIGLMKHSVRSMSKLLDDLLELRRISQNRIQLELTTTNVSSLLKKAVRLHADAFAKKGQSLNSRIDDNLWLKGDEVRLDQVFANLLVNASKYTPPKGSVTVVARRVGRMVEIRIEDNGYGIGPESLERIFDPFYQVKQDGAAASGLGIGLALCEKIVLLHGGEIRARSKGKGQGSTFIVKIPVVLPPSTSGQDGDAEAHPKPRQGLKVLMVEDNENILRTMPRQLESLGCVVFTARTGKEGLALAREKAPDTIFVDIGLPDMTGHELGERLRSEGFSKLLIALSGYSHKEVQDESSRAGFDYHLAKPSTAESLARILAEAE